MSLTISSNELQQVVRVTETLLAPLDHTSVDGWRRAVNRSVSALVGADSAVFMFPGAGGPLVYSEEITQEQLAPYPEIQPPPTASGEDVLAQVAVDRVATIESTYRRPDHGFYRSAYYNEYFRVAGMHSLVCMGYAFGGTGARPGVDDVATVQPMRVQRSRLPFGERERQLLSLVYPAFVTGVMAWRQLGSARDALLATLDGLGHAVLVCDAAGRRLHETPTLAAILTTDPEHATLRLAMQRAGMMCRAMGVVPGAAAGALAREVRTRTARYQIQACRYAGATSEGLANGSPSLVLVGLDRRTPVHRTDAELKAEFGLTPAELRVARLLAAGKRNDDIAGLLDVSSHTVRRHTEQVLRKLGTSTRAAVASRLSA